MKRNQYLYLGDKTGNKMFYSVNEEEFYQCETNNNGLRTSIIAFTGTVFYVWARNLNISELHYNETAYVICSAIIGILLAVVFHQYTVKTNESYFSKIGPAEVPPREQMVKVLRQASGITVIYSFTRILMLILVLFIPFLVKEQKNIVMFISYFILWFMLGYLYLHFNQAKRRKVLKMLRKQYLK